MECWIEITTPEISSHWKDEYFRKFRNYAYGTFQLDDGTTYHNRQTFSLKRCTKCREWLEVPHACPVVKTDRYTILLETAGTPINGWFFGVLFREGKSVDIRCPKHAQAQNRQRLKEARARIKQHMETRDGI